MSKFFGGNANKEKMDKFKEGVGGSGLYFNGGDIDEKGVKLRVIPWIFEGEVEEMIHHYEGWEAVPPAKKGEKEKGKPRRFTLDDEIPDGINWKMNQNQFTKAMEASVPKEALGFLAYIYKEKKIKLCGFTQATICKAFMAMKDEESEMFCSDLSKVDIIITRKADGKGFTVTFAPQSDPNLPVEAMTALEAGYLFSWDQYMKGLDPFDEKEGNVWKEVVAAMKGEKPKAQAPANKNTETKQQPTAGDSEELKEWRTVKQSNGKALGELTLPDLQKLKTLIETKKKTSMPIYPFVVYGVDHFEEGAAAPAADDNEIVM
jgi:hypothetical protein